MFHSMLVLMIDILLPLRFQALNAEVSDLRVQNTESAQGFTAAFETAHSMLEELDFELGLDGSFADIAEDLEPLVPPTHHFNAQEQQTPTGQAAC